MSRRTWTLVAVVLGSGIVFLDSTIVNVALRQGAAPELAARFRAQLCDEAWNRLHPIGHATPFREELRQCMLRRRVDHERVLSYADLFDHLEPGQLLAAPPDSWARDWELADPDTFRA